MIGHVVAFRLRAEDPAQRAADAERMRSLLEGLVGVVDGVTTLRVERDLELVPGHWDLVLLSEHPSREALAAYQADPRHQEVVAWVGTIVTERATVDYERE